MSGVLISEAKVGKGPLILKRELVANLKTVIDQANGGTDPGSFNRTKIVLSSSWRLYYKELEDVGGSLFL